MAFAIWAPYFWNPWMFLFPDMSTGVKRKPLERDEPVDGK